MSNAERLIENLNEVGQLIRPALHQFTRMKDDSLQDIIDHSLLPCGSRERPFLFKLACEACGADFKQLIPGAIAIELLHFSTLVSDDIIDDSSLRQNEPTVVAAYGTNAAIVASELMNSLAFLALIDLEVTSVIGSSQILRAVAAMKETQFMVFCGQHRDLMYEHNPEVTEDLYYEMIGMTTGSLVACSLKTGVILAAGSEDALRSLSEYGMLLGKAMQIRDDLCEIIGDSSIIGKQLGGDIRQGKMRLPLIVALSRCSGSEKSFLSKVIQIGNPEDSTIQRCIRIVQQCGAVEYSKEIASRFARDAIDRISPLPSSSSKDQLVEMAEVVGSVW